MITRRPAATSAPAMPGATQLRAASDAKPCMRSVSGPAPRTVNAISSPSNDAKRSIATPDPIVARLLARCKRASVQHLDTRVIRLADGRDLAWVELGDPDGAPVFVFHGAPGSAGQFVPLGGVAAGAHVVCCRWTGRATGAAALTRGAPSPTSQKTSPS